ncbi:hypothetical protein QSH57_000002 [Fusarium oxysporum f. sp. vasinfectum]|nr:hypothetical protein QSH57_000002 [Fusarium oxysporum f. sp. vasinfectum]
MGIRQKATTAELKQLPADEFVEAAEAVVAGQARQNGLTDEKMERLCLDMLIGMLDHQFKQSHYDSIVLSALAIMGINEDGGWMSRPIIRRSIRA